MYNKKERCNCARSQEPIRTFTCHLVFGKLHASHNVQTCPKWFVFCTDTNNNSSQLMNTCSCIVSKSLIRRKFWTVSLPQTFTQVVNIQIELGEHNNNGFLKELKPALYGGPFSSKLLKHFLGKRTKFSLFYNQSGFAYLGKWRPLLNLLLLF